MVRLRDLYGGAGRRRSLTVAGISAVGGALAGAVIGTTALAGAATHETPQPVSVHHKRTHHHKASPTPSYVATYSITTSKSPSASPTPTKSKSATPRATTTSPAPQPTTTSPAPAPTTAAPTEAPASASPPADGPASPGTG